MFELIRNIEQAFVRSSDFVRSKSTDMDRTGNTLVKSFPSTFPSLIDWFINYSWQGIEKLDSHICNRGTAKCLIYPKTNKPIAISWFVVRTVDDIPDAIYESPFFDSNSDPTKTDGFDEAVSVLEHAEQSTPLLVSARTLFKSRENKYNGIHISMVTPALAKSLVYYKKDTKELPNQFGSLIRKKYYLDNTRL